MNHPFPTTKIGLGCIGVGALAFVLGLGVFDTGPDARPSITPLNNATASVEQAELTRVAVSDTPVWWKDGQIDAAILARLPRFDAENAGAACFTPGTSPEVMRRINDMIYPQQQGERYFVGSRWPGPAGTPFDLTWSFVPDGTPTDNGDPSTLFATLDAQFGGNRALWMSLFEQSFARWAELTGMSYTRITVGGNDWDDGATWGSTGSATRGDSRINSRFIDGNVGSNVLAFNFFPGSGGDMVIDNGNSWSSSTNNFRFLRDVVMHEHGHGLGVFHVCSSDNAFLMEPFINTSFDGPQHDDLRAAQRLYGDPSEPNDTSLDAAPLILPALGVLKTHGTVPAPAIPDSSIFGISGIIEQDWYSFATTAPRRTTISIEPAGLSYDSSPQVGGDCTSGNPNDSRTMFDLAFELIDTDGTTILATGNVQPSGGTETVTDVFLPLAGEYFIRVFETGGTNQSQLYFIKQTVDDPFPCQINICADPPGVPAFPHSVKKNRYVSFTPENAGATVGFRVEMTAGPSVPVVLGWVGEPIDPSCQEFDGSPLDPPEPCEGIDALARIVDTPVLREWNEPIIHVGDCGIAPVATYEIRASSDGILLSDPVEIQTSNQPADKVWGDTNGANFGLLWGPPDGLVNLNDLQASILKFKRRPGAPHITWVDIAGQRPNGFINVSDIQFILLAFQAKPYPFVVPADCP